MKQKPKVRLRIILLSMALLTGWLVFGTAQPVAADNSQSQNQISVNLAGNTLINSEVVAKDVFNPLACQKQDLSTYNDIEILDYRWEAMAEFYTADKDLTTYNAGEISVYRWEAMAKFYVADNNLTTFNAEEILAYRWQSLGEFYTSRQICPT